MNDADLNLQYLDATVRCVDARVRAMLRATLDAGQDPQDRFRGLYISNQEAQRLSGASRRAPEPAGDQEDLRQVLQAAEETCRRIEQAAGQMGVELRLAHLKQGFELNEFEYQAFLVCLLPALDRSYERMYGYLQDDVTQKLAGVDLILKLLNPGAPGVARLENLDCFGSAGVLLRYRLIRPQPSFDGWVEPRLDQHFEVPPAVVAWLLGGYFPEENWVAYFPAEAVSAEPGELPLPLDWARLVEFRPLLAFSGPDEERQRQAARGVAAEFHLPLLEVQLGAASGPETLTPAMLRLLIRDACLLGAVTYIRGWEAVLDAHGFVPGVLLEELSNFGGLFILGSKAPWRLSERGSRPVFQVAFPQPNGLERFRLWQQALGAQGEVPLDVVRHVAGQYILTSGQVRNAVFNVVNQSYQSGQPYSSEDLFQAARQQSSHHLEQLAQKVEPRYAWPDIVLPAEEIGLLHSIVSTVRHRSLVLEEWGLGKKLASSAGIAALFTGEPGTGKTLAAQVIAAELRQDLYRIDLSTVVSKYIGETEKNLERIFREAHNSNAILFFDEADSIFGKRSEVKDAHDRYANIEVGYLLQRMENYDGVTILATNLRTNIDEAFTRRLQFIISFPFPDEAQRLAIWKVLLPPGLPVEAGLDWGFMARRYPLAGGSIRNILVTAAFLAAQEDRQVGMQHLVRATRQEMQKMGRLIREEDYV
ncbi:MAG: ATP-binding protein, partial [Chloroflexi bacterium]|nr:ATP-binding protein [Chloroflexota bacterium]